MSGLDGRDPHFDYVDHVGIVVAHADEAVEYFRNTLGMAVLGDEHLDEIKVRLVYLDASNVMLQLVEPTGAGPVRDHLDARGEGLHHICFGVDDIPATLSQLNGEAHSRVFQGGRGRPACFLRAQPSSVLLELTERAPRILDHLGVRP